MESLHGIFNNDLCKTILTFELKINVYISTTFYIRYLISF